MSQTSLKATSETSETKDEIKKRKKEVKRCLTSPVPRGIHTFETSWKQLLEFSDVNAS